MRPNLKLGTVELLIRASLLKRSRPEHRSAIARRIVTARRKAQ